MSKKLFWICGQWPHEGHVCSIVFLVAAQNIEEGKKLVIEHFRKQNITATTGLSFLLANCWCVTEKSKIVEAQPL